MSSAADKTPKIELPDALAQCLEGRLAQAIDLAIQGGNSTLEWFQKPDLSVERKGDDSPVTVADRHAETLMRDIVCRAYPKDAILGEEFGETEGSSEFQWIMDPIDGTKSFISGVPLYSTLIGIVSGKSCLGGVIYIPALNEMVFAAQGLGAWHSRGGSPAKRVHVSGRPLNEGLFTVSQVDNFEDRGAGEAFHHLEREAYITRTWGDGYGYLLVATGRAELMVDPIANAWDLAAVQPVIEEAGGIFSTWKGEASVFGGDGVGANPNAHATAMKTLNQHD